VAFVALVVTTAEVALSAFTLAELVWLPLSYMGLLEPAWTDCAVVGLVTELALLTGLVAWLIGPIMV
jgi:hypothetical protein